MASEAETTSLLSTGAVARRLGLSRHTVHRAVRDGALSPTQRTPGGYLRFAPAAVAAYGRSLALAEDTVTPENEGARLFTLAQDPMCVAGTDGYFKRVNPAFSTALGWTAAELLGRPYVDFVHPDDREVTVAEASHVGGGAPTLQFENRYRHKDGSWRWLSWRSTPVAAEGLIYAVARDMTAQKQAETALRASEERYRQVEENAPIGLALVGLDGRWLRINPALCALVGYTAAELLERTFQDITHPADLDADLEQVRQVLAGAIDGYQMEKRYIRKDGSLVWVLLSVSLLRDTAGRPLSFVSQIQDIDQRKRAEERLQTVLAHAPIALTAIDQDGIVTFSSGHGLKALGPDRPSSVGRSVFDVLADAPAVREQLRRALAGAPVTVMIPSGGRLFETHYTPVRAADGHVDGVIGVATDVTERVEAEEARRASEGRYRQLVELAQEGIWQIDTTGHARYVNPKMADLLGYTAAEMLGRPFEDFMDDEGRALARETRDLFPQGHAALREYKFVRKDGTVLWALLTTAFLYDATGQEVGAFATVTDNTARKREEEHLRQLAHHDALTGLPNRTLFADRLAQDLGAARRRGRPLAVLLVDLDGFKQVNDTLGHAAGDTVLRTVAERLRATVRDVDTVARLGGDEFALILPETGEAGAVATVRKLLAALAMPLQLDGCPVEVGGSIGIALAPTHGGDQARLLRGADVAMYQAKRARRGHAVYAPGGDEHAPQRSTLPTADRLPSAPFAVE